MSVSESAEPEEGFKFAVGQRLFALHGPVMYEARCVNTKWDEKGKPSYLIHYHGWNKNWDEWMSDDRLAEYTDENRERAEQMSKEAKNKKRGSSKIFKRKSLLNESAPGDGSSPQPSTSKDEKFMGFSEPRATGGKESSGKSNQGSALSTPLAKIKEEVKQEFTSVKGKKGRKAKIPRVDIDDIQLIEHNKNAKIEIPSELNDVLVDDHNYIEQQNMILNLEDSKTVSQVLDDYIKRRKEDIEQSKKSATSDVNATLQQCPNEPRSKITEISCFVEVCAGLRRYFNEMLGNQLLYKYERPQYAQVLRKIEKDLASEPNDKFRSRKNSTATKTTAAGTTQDGESDTTSKQLQTGKKHRLVEYYAPIHLLRLLIRLDQILSSMNMDEKALRVIALVASDLLVYLKEEREQLFSPSNYYAAPPDYDRMAT